MQGNIQHPKTGRATRSSIPRFTIKALPLAAALCCGVTVQAQGINPGTAGLPQGGTVAAGAMAGELAGDRLTLTQGSARAVLDWRSFNIDAGKEVRFVQPDASAAVLNRVSASAGMSEIYGALNANGMVLLMNPNGVLFGRGASINVGSLIATTGTVHESRFMQEGAVAITGAGAGSVRNQGAITAAQAGLVALVAPAVSNEGTIVAHGGAILLAGASAATVSFNGGLYEFVTGGAGSAVGNSGLLQADGGAVLLTASQAGGIVDSVINMDGIIQARTLDQREGRIVLDGGDNGRVLVSGRLDASGTPAQRGGRITVTGHAVALSASAQLDASGEGGGTVLVGGNWQGLGAERHAAQTTVARGAVLAADGGEAGDGGTVVVWADGETRFQGRIHARGGTRAGDGGRVEVSGKQSLGFDGTVDASAAAGQAGSLLLDPLYAVISGAASGIEGDTQTINAAALVSSLSGAHVTVQADDRITVNAAVDASLNANARNLALNAPTVDLDAMIRLKSPATLSGTASTVYVNGSDASIQNGVDVAAVGATVHVAAGTYAEQVSIGKAGLTLAGATGARLLVPDGPTTPGGPGASYDGITIRSSNVTVSGFEIAGPLSAPYEVYYAGDPGLYPWTNVSRGIVVQQGAGGFTLTGNDLHDLRTGILVNGRDSAGTGAISGSITGNRIENTRSAISVQYTDGAALTIAGNSQGPVGNEWGVNLHLNGFLDGGVVRSNPYLTAPTLAWQQALLDLSAANGGWSVQDQGYVSSNRTHVVVATGTSAATTQGSPLTSFTSLQSGVNAVIQGGQVQLRAGSYSLPATLTIAKSLTLAGAGEGSTVIDARGIGSGYGMSVSADDVTLRHFTFYGPSAFYASAYGIKVAPGGDPDARLRNFRIEHVTSRGAGKAELDLNGVDGAVIDSVTLNGAPAGNDSGATQGAGLQLTDSANVTVRNTTTLNNSWGGVALYQANRSYNQQVDNISLEGNNHFSEANPVYLQDESASRDFGRLNIAGFDYAVRNASNAGSSQYTWLQATPQGAYDLAVNLPGLNPGYNASASYIQGWNGAARTDSYAVGTGHLAAGGTQAMSLAAAIGQSATGDTITVDAGQYAEVLTLNGLRKLRFNDAVLQGLGLDSGAGGSGIGGAVTATTSAGIVFQAPVTLLADTTLRTQGADIVLGGDLQNAGSTPYALTLVAGSGSSRGNVYMTTGGTASNPLGALAVAANDFFLSDTLWVRSYGIDARGNVALSHHTLNATASGVTNTLAATGNVTGSTTSQGSVEVVSAALVDLNVAAQGRASVAAETVRGTLSGAEVMATAQDVMQVTVTAGNTATLAASTMTATVVAPTVAVDAGGAVQLNLQSTTASVHADGPVVVQGSAATVHVDAPSGSLQGSFGDVSNAGTGVFSVNGRPELNQTLSANAENNRVIPGNSALAGSLGSEGAPRPIQGVALALAGRTAQAPLVRVSPQAAGTALLEQGQAVEIDLAPGRERE